MARSILIVDDDPAIRTSLAEALAEQTTEVRAAPDAERALALLAAAPAGVVLAGGPRVRAARRLSAANCCLATR